MTDGQNPLSEPEGLTASEPDEFLLFHYTKFKTLLKILNSGEMRLSPYASTNDPRETKEWIAEVIADATKSGDDALLIADEVRRLADPILRGGARLACFTLDRKAGFAADAGALFHRGWARARMWSQYAENHRGACLVFQRDQMVGQVDEERPIRDGDLFSCGRVVYEDKPLRVAMTLSGVHPSGALEVLDSYQITRGVAGELYFTKNTDWSAENEFRIVVVRWNLPWEELNDPLDIPYGPALRAVVLGERFPDSNLKELQEELARFPDVETWQCTWEGGSPHLALLDIR